MPWLTKTKCSMVIERTENRENHNKTQGLEEMLVFRRRLRNWCLKRNYTTWPLQLCACWTSRSTILCCCYNNLHSLLWDGFLLDIGLWLWAFVFTQKTKRISEIRHWCQSRRSGVQLGLRSGHFALRQIVSSQSSLHVQGDCDAAAGLSV